jgi:hypothetical protein
MQEELRSINKMKTWELVTLPPGKRAISCKWVFTRKPGLHGQGEQKKARLVAKGCQQHQGVDFDKTFTPIAKWHMIKAISALARISGWTIFHHDIKTAFLNGRNCHDVYMKQSLGYSQPGTQHLVCKLNRALYGLKQGSRNWYAKIHKFLIKNSLKQSSADGNLYYTRHNGKLIILVLYVDDLFITGNDITFINKLKTQLHQKFEMTNLGPCNQYLGLEFEQTPQGLRLHQTSYAQSIVDDFGLTDCNPTRTPLPTGLKLRKDTKTPYVDRHLYQQMVGKLIFLTNTRYDIAFSVNLVARYMQAPQQAHLQAIQSIIRYIKGTTQTGLFYSRNATLQLTGYSDADWRGDLDERKSTGAFLFTIGSTPITWNTKKKTCVALFSTESEYRTLVEVAKEAVWIRNLYS